jgi:hypothetical protein
MDSVIFPPLAGAEPDRRGSESNVESKKRKAPDEPTESPTAKAAPTKKPAKKKSKAAVTPPVSSAPQIDSTDRLGTVDSNVIYTLQQSLTNSHLQTVRTLRPHSTTQVTPQHSIVSSLMASPSCPVFNVIIPLIHSPTVLQEKSQLSEVPDNTSEDDVVESEFACEFIALRNIVFNIILFCQRNQSRASGAE